jgi:periplasmic protein TonB
LTRGDFPANSLPCCYPLDRSTQNAEVVISFALDRTGPRPLDANREGSGDASLDEAALAMLARSDPVPPPPPLVAAHGLSFTVPVIFSQQAKVTNLSR